MATLTDLPIEIIIYIEQLCNERDIVSVLKTCKKFYNYRFLMKYRFQVKYQTINKSPYFNSFTNIVYDKIAIFPVNLRYLTFAREFNQDIKGVVPNSVTHLTFGDYFNQDI